MCSVLYIMHPQVTWNRTTSTEYYYRCIFLRYSFLSVAVMLLMILLVQFSFSTHLLGFAHLRVVSLPRHTDLLYEKTTVLLMLFVVWWLIVNRAHIKDDDLWLPLLDAVFMFFFFSSPLFDSLSLFVVRNVKDTAAVVALVERSSVEPCL